jgi:hypothetical protein
VKTSPTMQTLITAIIARHGANLDAGQLHLRLEHAPYEPLVIERTGPQRISVAHYYEQNGDLIPDPDVVFYTGQGEWVPIEITDCFGHRSVATVDGDRLSFHPRQQADLAAFVNVWARNLKAQGWLTAARTEA